MLSRGLVEVHEGRVTQELRRTGLMRLTEGEDLGVPMDKKGGEERAKKVLRYFELYCMTRPLDSLI